MTTYPNDWFNPCNEPDYSDTMPEREPYQFQFRDGSSVILIEDEDPIVKCTSQRKLANEFMVWYEENCPDNHEDIEYLTKNYK